MTYETASSLEAQEVEREFLGTATYSPEDNKLRFYPFARLDAADYERAKAAGFKWAPRQELFVAQMWTPGRERLMLEWCGEVGDEDTSLSERAEERAERFGEYSENRGKEAQAARDAASRIADAIPFGQPILVGHHSERRARKDAQRIQDGMRKSCSLWETAEYWERRAAAAVSHAKYKERPDVRHRRIKGIEADRRKSEKNMTEAQELAQLWALPLTLDVAIALTSRGHLTFIDGGERTYAHDALTREVDPWPVERVAERAIKAYTSAAASAAVWVKHYDNRLTYERAMLAADGGIAADKFDIQPGGRVLVRHGWATVVRVTRKAGVIVSVTTNQNMVPVRGIEEVKDYQPPSTEAAAAAKAATKKPPLVNYPHEGAHEITQAKWNATHKDYKGTREVGQGARVPDAWRPMVRPAGVEQYMAHRVRTMIHHGALVTVFLTDARTKYPEAAPTSA